MRHETYIKMWFRALTAGRITLARNLSSRFWKVLANGALLGDKILAEALDEALAAMADGSGGRARDALRLVEDSLP